MTLNRQNAAKPTLRGLLRCRAARPKLRLGLFYARRRACIGFQQRQLSLFLPDGGHSSVLHRPRALSRRPEFCAARREPLFLRLCRTARPAAAALFRTARLGRGPAAAACAATEGLARRRRHSASGAALLVQIRRVRRGHLRHTPAGDNPAHRHLLLHLPGPELRSGRLPRRHAAQPLAGAGGAVHLLLPAAHRRADSALYRRRPGHERTS